MFINISPSVKKYYFDSCVWSLVSKGNGIREKFITTFQQHNNLVALSQFSIFELSRASHILEDLDKLFYDMQYNIWIPQFYDELLNEEVKNYPHGAAIKFAPISIITEKNKPNVMTKLSNDQRIKSTRDEFLQFGFNEFMSLEDFKKNYPPENPAIGYTIDEADFFCWANNMQYLSRHFLSFLLQFKENPSNLDTNKIPSIQSRSLLLFYKFYIHGQTPNKSDFLDFAHVSYAPYFDYFVTEKNIGNVMKHIKQNSELFRNTAILTVNEFQDHLQALSR